MSQLEVITNTINDSSRVVLVGSYTHDTFKSPYILQQLFLQSKRTCEAQRTILACSPKTDLDTWSVVELDEMLQEATANGLEPTKVEPFREHGRSISRGRVHFLEPIGHLSLSGSIQLNVPDIESPPADTLERELEIVRRIIVTLAPRREFLESLLLEGTESLFPASLGG